MMASVSLLDLPRQTATIRNELDAAIARVLDHGQFILGPEVAQLEAGIAEYCGTRFAVACASGSDALLLPLLGLRVAPGDRVITTPFTFFASAGSISRAGAIPVFVDIESSSFNMDPVLLTRYLESLPAKDRNTIKAIIPVHLFGQCADMEEINTIASRFGIPVIEDAAQAIGAQYGGRRAGGLGWCGCFSFFPSKNLGGFGDGGIITTDDAELADKLRSLRVHGSGGNYFHREVGINSRLDTIQAAVLLVKLRYLDQWTAMRRANAATYRSLLRELPEAKLTLPPQAFGRTHVYNQFTIRIARRDEVRQQLIHHGVATAIYYPLPLHLQQCFASLGYSKGDFPVSEAAAAQVLSLPIEAGLNQQEVERVAKTLATLLAHD